MDFEACGVCLSFSPFCSLSLLKREKQKDYDESIYWSRAPKCIKGCGPKGKQHAFINPKPWPYFYSLSILFDNIYPLGISWSPQSTAELSLRTSSSKVQNESAGACNSWGRHCINVSDTRLHSLRWLGRKQKIRSAFYGIYIWEEEKRGAAAAGRSASMGCTISTRQQSPKRKENTVTQLVIQTASLLFDQFEDVIYIY